MKISEKEIKRRVASVIKAVHDLPNSSRAGQLSCLDNLYSLNNMLGMLLENEQATVKHCRLDTIFSFIIFQ